MACRHRFYDKLSPDWELEYLFVGTFNPSWDFNNAEQADYFYGRNRNFFWRILPEVFENESLKNNHLIDKIEYLRKNKIGLTDLIISVENANESSKVDVDNLTIGFSDNVLNNYILEFNTENIINLITKNSKTIKGVFLTRSTLNNINQIRDEWAEIERFCLKNKINTNRLLTPARNYSVRKVIDWQNKILNK
ncbi:MAG: hypothetical protein A3G95_08905 [Flavobacteria bacterium RIFCSPLOWO2_12_FULL_31_7]|nr:MAG: hypothetical protein A3G95_08905 [Flavobacteria bacterium RIFCSPLOWO2_12_FULL_31_7]